MGLIECFAACDPRFAYDRSLNPRRVLTKPSRPVHNNGHDNEKWDYILYVNDVIGNEEGRKYVILDLLGQGTFGQVVKCTNLKTRELCAVKVIKNQPAYFNQSMMEVTVLEMLNQKYDREDRRHIVRMRDTFIFRQHLCIVVELLSLNLYELIKQNGYRGFSLGLCRVFLAQTLDALTVLKEARIIHCDLKPENILLKSLEAPIIKVIDYGSACHEHQTVYTYIQSRFYRSPEIILGLPYTSSIDMWSVGCIAAELFLGLPIFPGCSNYDQISRVVECLGVPPHHMLEMGKDALTYFDKFPNQPPGRAYALKSRERYSFETGRPEPLPKKYFATTTFPQIIFNYPMRSSKELSAADRDMEMANRRCFADFAGGLLNLNPLERWNPYQAMQHPFITGRPFVGPFQPTVLPMLSPVALKTPHVMATAGAIAAPEGHLARQPKQPPPTVAPLQSAQRSRPRSNTLSTLTFQDVPPQLQRLAAASKAQPAPPPATQRVVPDDQMLSTSFEGPGLFSDRRGSISQRGASRAGQATSPTGQGSTPGYVPGPAQGSSLGPANASNPPLQAHQRLSAYMTNRRVSNPPGMFPPMQSQSHQIPSVGQQPPPASQTHAHGGYFPTQQGMPSSLPASTGFFYYNNVAAPMLNADGPSPTHGSPTLANMGRRNSLRGTSQLSMMTSSTASASIGQRRGSMPYAGDSMSGSFGAMHPIDEDSVVSGSVVSGSVISGSIASGSVASGSAASPDYPALNDSLNSDDPMDDSDGLDGEIDCVSMQDTDEDSAIKRQRKRT